MRGLPLILVEDIGEPPGVPFSERFATDAGLRLRLLLLAASAASFLFRFSSFRFAFASFAAAIDAASSGPGVSVRDFGLSVPFVRGLLSSGLLLSVAFGRSVAFELGDADALSCAMEVGKFLRPRGVPGRDGRAADCSWGDGVGLADGGGSVFLAIGAAAFVGLSAVAAGSGDSGGGGGIGDGEFGGKGAEPEAISFEGVDRSSDAAG